MTYMYMFLLVVFVTWMLKFCFFTSINRSTAPSLCACHFRNPNLLGQSDAHPLLLKVQLVNNTLLKKDSARKGKSRNSLEGKMGFVGLEYK